MPCTRFLSSIDKKRTKLEAQLKLIKEQIMMQQTDLLDHISEKLLDDSE